jgi:hypothetical protein
VDGPDGDRSHPSQDGGGDGASGGGCAIRPDNCAPSARAPKSVIDLKFDAELSDFRSGETLKGIPAAVTIPQRRDLSDRADAFRLQRLEIIPARRSAAGRADLPLEAINTWP